MQLTLAPQPGQLILLPPQVNTLPVGPVPLPTPPAVDLLRRIGPKPEHEAAACFQAVENLSDVLGPRVRLLGISGHKVASRQLGRIRLDGGLDQQHRQPGTRMTVDAVEDAEACARSTSGEPLIGKHRHHPLVQALAVSQALLHETALRIQDEPGKNQARSPLAKARPSQPATVPYACASG